MKNEFYNDILIEDCSSNLITTTIFNEEVDKCEILAEIEIDKNILSEDFLLDENYDILNEKINFLPNDADILEVATDATDKANVLMQYLSKSMYLIPRGMNTIDVNATKDSINEYLKNYDMPENVRLFDGKDQDDMANYNSIIKNMSLKRNLKKAIKSALGAVITIALSMALLKGFQTGKSLGKKGFNTLKQVGRTGKLPPKNNAEKIGFFKKTFGEFFTKDSVGKFHLTDKAKLMGGETIRSLIKYSASAIIGSALNYDDSFLFLLDGKTILTFYPKTQTACSSQKYPAFLLLVNKDTNKIIFKNISICGKHID